MFWPLISATVAVGAVVTYTRWRCDGRGWLSDIAWVIAAATLAIGFVTQPSQIMLQVDSLREQLAAKVITGTTTALTPDTLSVTGYQNPALTGPAQEVAARSLVAGLWDSFGSTPWCLAQFHELDICKVAGAHKLAGDDTWKQWEHTMADNGQVTEFGTWQNWVRGMDLGRLGYVLIMLMMALPMAILTLILVIAGFSAVVGFAAMFLLGVVALVGWPIPGWFRRFGTKWWEYTLGLQLQALFVTVILAAVMLVSKFIGSHVDTYGFFIVGLLNIVLMFWAVKAKAFIESLTMMGGGGSAGMLGMMAAWTGMRAGGWALGKVGHFGRQVIRSPYNAGRYVRDRAKGLDWTSRTGQTEAPASPARNMLTPTASPTWTTGHGNSPRRHHPRSAAGLARSAPPAPAAVAPLVPRPPSRWATRHPTTRAAPPPSPSGGDGPYQAPVPARPHAGPPLPSRTVAPRRATTGAGNSAPAPPTAPLRMGGGPGHPQRALGVRPGRHGRRTRRSTAHPPPTARPSSGGKPATPRGPGASDPRPEPRRRRIARSPADPAPDHAARRRTHGRHSHDPPPASVRHRSALTSRGTAGRINRTSDTRTRRRTRCPGTEPIPTVSRPPGWTPRSPRRRSRCSSPRISSVPAPACCRSGRKPGTGGNAAARSTRSPPPAGPSWLSCSPRAATAASTGPPARRVAGIRGPWPRC